MKEQHTPGPWILDDESREITAAHPSRVLMQWREENWKPDAFGGPGRICVMMRWVNVSGEKYGPPELIGLDELRANGRLIAAAPDLLKACESILGGRFPEDYQRVNRAISREEQLMLRNAVNKARGF